MQRLADGERQREAKANGLHGVETADLQPQHM